MNNQDSKMIAACTRDGVIALFKDFTCEHPMDEDVINALKNLYDRIKDRDDDYEIFRYRSDTDRLWGTLLEKAIKCLRYYDAREPFQRSNGEKKPKAYGIDDLKDYYKKYAEFERVLYGSSRYYRDHVIHVLRTWLSGIELLTRNDGAYLDQIAIQEKKSRPSLNLVEKISMWTIIALTHDLGYPLQKAKDIIDITQNMLSTFITNPDISVDFAFHGVQNYMNDYVVRLMSSKMEERKRRKDNSDETPEGGQLEEYEQYYVARLQSKYYFKFQKSLERNSHGILSTLIIYKLLTYFLESDYNINEDYAFDQEECRQFYIRREILRAIASHTCDDIYQMYMGSFSFLLRICDDTQEWGRKNISELYVKSGQKYELKDIELSFDAENKANCCIIQEQMTILDREGAINLIHRFREQALVYVTIFRDGQDTIERDFSFTRNLTIAAQDVSITLKLEVDKARASQLSGEITYTSDAEKNRPFGKEFFTELAADCDWRILGSNGDEIISPKILKTKKEAELPAPLNWHNGRFEIPLAN